MRYNSDIQTKKQRFLNILDITGRELDEYRKNGETAPDDKKSFEIIAESKNASQEMLASLLTQRVEDEYGHKVFITDEKERKSGYLSNIYGYVGVLSLVLRMNATVDAELRKDIEDNVCMILDEIYRDGYTMEPYLSDEEGSYEDGSGDRVPLFDVHHPYTGAMTWALSFFSSVRKAVDLGIISLSEERQREIVERIREIIVTFNQSVIKKDGKVCGWGFTDGCDTPSLFFTYSVLEAYSDFEDSLSTENKTDDDNEDEEDENKDLENERLANKVEELLAALNEDVHDGKHIEQEWKDNCFEVADYVWDAYKDVLKEEFVDDTFLEGFRVVRKDDILKSDRSNALFNNIYLVSILLYGYVNTRPVGVNGKKRDTEEVIMTMEAALQNVQRVYDQLLRNGLEYLVDTYIIPFKSKQSEHGDAYMKKLNYKMLIDATLQPLLVKANNIIAFYISQFPVKQMKDLFWGMFDSMQDAEILWEKKNYDVKINERYIEAVADFYDYYDTYERQYAEGDAAIGKKIQEGIDRSLAKRMRTATARLEKQITKDTAKAHADEIEKLQAGYTIENAIRASVRAMAESLFLDSMRHVADSFHGGARLNDFEKQLRETVETIIKNYLMKQLIDVTATKSLSETAQKNLNTDLKQFLAEWTEKLDTSDETLTNILKGDRK